MNDFENYIILICSKNISRFTEKKSRRDIDNTRFVEFGEDWNVLVHGLSRRMAEWCSYVSPIEFEESDVLSYQAIIFANSTKRGRTLLVFRFRRVLTRHLSPRSKPLEFEWNPAKVGRKWRFSVAYFHSRRGEKKKKNASRSGGEDSIVRPLRRGLTGCNGEPLRWRDEAEYLLTYLLRRKPRKSYTRSLAAVLCS